MQEADQNCEVVLNIQDKKKHIAVDVLLKGYAMVALSCRSNLAGRYLLLAFQEHDERDEQHGQLQRHKVPGKRGNQWQQGLHRHRNR